jgi:hypothetical protein
MSNTIVDVGGDKVVRMSNSRFARAPLLELFTSWTKIRVGAYLTVQDSGANLVVPGFAMGLCAGSTNIPGDATCDHFVGVHSHVTNWERAATPLRYVLANQLLPKKIVDGVLTTADGAFDNNYYHGIPIGLFCCLFIDITKGSPDYGFQLFAPYGGSSGVDLSATQAEFDTQMITNVPSLSNHRYMGANSAPYTLPVNEAVDGVFTHACMLWDQSVPTMDVSAFSVYRIS